MNLRKNENESAHDLSMEKFLAEMKAAGIGKAVVMARKIGDRNASVSNEDVKKLVDLYPDQFIPFGGVDLSAGIANALKELRTCLDYNFRGIALEPGWNDPPRMPDDAVFYPIYALCEREKLPVALTVSMWQGPTLEYSNPARLQKIANDFPELRIIAAHGCYPWILEAFNAALVNPNIWLIPDLYMNHPVTPGRQLYLDCCRWLRCERILFGSAYPCYELMAAVEDVRGYGFTPEEFEKLTYGNACRLLNIC